MERKEQQLKESLLKFDKFLKENDAKRARAIKKATDEKELCKVKGKGGTFTVVGPTVRKISGQIGQNFSKQDVSIARVRNPWLALFELTNHNPSSSITLHILVM